MKRLTIRGTALTLGLFFDVTFVLCVVWAIAAPAHRAPLQAIWEAILPGFTWLTPASFALGLVEAFLYGLYVAVVFVPLFNYFEGGKPSELTNPTTPPLGRAAVAHH